MAATEELTDLPEGFTLDAVEASDLPEGFVLDEADPGSDLPAGFQIDPESPPDRGLVENAMALGERFKYGASLGTIGVTKAKVTLLDRPIYEVIRRITGQDVSSLAEEEMQNFGAAEQNISTLAQEAGGGEAGNLAEAVGSAIPQLAIQLPVGLSAAALGGGDPNVGLWASSLTSGAMQGAQTYEAAKSAYLEQGKTPEEASDLALNAGLASAGATTLISRAFGTSGVDVVFKNFGGQAVKQGLVKFLLKEGVTEGVEETMDQAVQSAIEKTTYNPNLTFDQALHQTLLAGGAGAIVGGGVSTAVHVARNRQAARNVGPATAATVDQLGQVSPEITARVSELRAAREGRVGEANIAAEAALSDAESLLSQPLTPEPSDVTTQAQAPPAETPAISTAEDVSPIAGLPGAVQPIQLGGEEQPTGGVLTPVPDFSVVLPDAPDIPVYLSNAWVAAQKNVPLVFTAIESTKGNGGLGLYTVPNEDGTSTLLIDADEIAQFGESQERITRALGEEGLHAQDVKAIHGAWEEEAPGVSFLEYLNNYWSGISSEMTPAQKELVNRTYHGEEKFNSGARLDTVGEGAEFMRMLLQDDITGVLTEGGRLGITREQLAPTTALGKILRAIQKFFDPNIANNPLAARHFDRLKALVQETASATPTPPKSLQTQGLKFNGTQDGVSMFTEEDPDSPARGGTFAIEGEVTPEKVQAARTAQNERFSGNRPPMLGASSVTPNQDRAYMDAVNRGDTETAQRMVDEAAKKAGYNPDVFYHITPNHGMKDILPRAFYVTPTEEGARAAGDKMFRGGTSTKILRVYIPSDLVVRDVDSGSSFLNQLTLEQQASIAKASSADALRGSFDGIPEIVIFNPQGRIKSADPVTRDGQGNIIPLSQRFNPKSNSILAASAVEEPGSPNEREKSFIKRQRANYYVEDALKVSEKIDPLYEVLPNKVLFSKAKTDNLSDPNTMATLLDPNSKISPSDRVARSIDLYETLLKARNLAEQQNDTEAVDYLAEQAVNLIDAIDTQMGREYGRAIQAMRGRMGPAEWIRDYRRQIDKATEPLRNSLEPDLEGLQTAMEEAKDQIPTSQAFKDRIKKVITKTEKKAESKGKTFSFADFLADILKNANGDAAEISTALQDQAGLSKAEADSVAKALIEAEKAEIAAKAQAELEKIVKNANKKKVAKAIKNRMEKLVDLAMKDGLTRQDVWDAVAEGLGLPAFDLETAKEIQRRAQDIQTNPKYERSPIEKGRAINDLANFIAGKSGVDPIDILSAWWYGSVLSGIKTQERNFGGGLIRTAYEAGITAVDQAIINKDIRAATTVVEGYLRGFAKALPAVDDVIRRGDFTGQYSFEAQRALNPLERIPADSKGIVKILSKAKYVSRFMAAMDILNATAAAENRAALRAYQQFKKANVSGSEISQAIQTALANTPEQIKAATIQAETEGYTGMKAKRRIAEILEMQRPSEWNEDARNYGLYATYNSPQVHGWVGALSRFFETGFNALEREGNKSDSKAVKALSRFPRLAILPFNRIVGNVTNFLINATPLAALRFFKAKKFLGPNATENDARLLQGTILVGNIVVMGIVARLAMEDLKDEEDRRIDLVGPGPKDPKQRKQWREAGNVPWSLQWRRDDGTIYNMPYQYTPMGMALGMVGAYRDAQKYSTQSDDSLGARSAAAALSGTLVITDMSFLQGVQNIFQLIDQNQSPESFMKSLVRTPAKLAGGLAPNLLKEMAAWISPEIPDTKTSVNELAAMFTQEVPVLRETISGKPQINTLAEPVKVHKYPWEVFLDIRETSEQWKLLSQLQAQGVFIPEAQYQNKIDPQTGARNLKMNRFEDRAFFEARGKIIKEVLSPDLLKDIVDLSKEDPQAAQDQIESIVRDASEQAKSELGF